MNDREYFIASSASLRIFGENIDFSLIENTLGLEPTKKHRKGECTRDIKFKNKKDIPDCLISKHDMWIFKSSLDKDKALGEHLLYLRNLLEPNIDFLKSLKERYAVDIFCGYRSNNDQGGVSLKPEELQIFNDCGINLELSIIIT